jgi:hypothetical protein
MLAPLKLLFNFYYAQATKLLWDLFKTYWNVFSDM